MAQPRETRPPGSRAEQLRASIDSGRTGDKVAYPDPAAAPLGADDEAANASSGGAAFVEPASAQAQADARRGTPSGNPGARSRMWIYVAAAIAALVILLLLGTMMPYRAQ